MSESRLRVLVVDNEERERREIRELLEDACSRFKDGRQARLEWRDLGTPEEVSTLAECLRLGDTPYQFILCDVFMPQPGGGTAVKEDGWRRLFDALRESYQAGRRTNDDVYLVAITHMPTAELKLEINRLIKAATREIGRQ